MGLIKYPSPVKLIIGLIFRDPGLAGKAKEKVEESFGPIDFQSPTYPFLQTNYYYKEMGGNLKREFISLAELVAPDALPKIKILTNQIEDQLSSPDSEKGRRVNIDPGYINSEKMILATTKNYTHRPYLTKGIYADLTYRFYKGSFRPLDWTYPDYRLPQYIEIFNTIRKSYVEQLKNVEIQSKNDKDPRISS
ncbi:MAG: DUF4416 family protein [Candidatus Tectomicrobia bacterium]|uniref:DUF4416 family protein n=1 Tax=Tectimicrobiota bacterium TaxID=2528274 RepID=A0A933LR15_UNCTE|nr:DUF4416 family protein [Candidatus Tectomicrobia bacterium]